MARFTPEELAALRAEDRGPLCKRIVISFTVLAFVSVCLRLYTRIRFRKTGWEDWTIIVSMIVSVGTAVCQILQVNAGNGKHAIFVSYPEGVSEVLKYLYFSIITYNISLTVTKISILLQLWYTNASVNIFTDLMVAVIPVRGIWSLQIPKRQKTALLGILTIGWFVCIVSVLRVAPTAYWSNIEANLAIVCASLPALKPLVVKIVPVFGTRHSSRGRGSTAASGNSHRLHKFGSKSIWRPSDDKEKLTSGSSASHAQSVASTPSENENHGRNIYVTKHFEQHVENNNMGPRESDQEVTAAEFLARGGGR
ncbi:hypothetical protein N0V87_002572 [Didymella glomerata]|uniref:Rhodopsin domain-containing protein n=1 Tax=Didymella glomerata TaxID=749621 RepID=A0A9W8X498_9PLEO|nr:hypothetical protein N0V87_002572 [Didymella glomerata]